MKLAATKKETTNIMKKMSDYFPSIYNFYPRTYTLPDDLPEFMGMYQNEPKTYIAKPDKGTQG